MIPSHTGELIKTASLRRISEETSWSSRSYNFLLLSEGSIRYFFGNVRGEASALAFFSGETVSLCPESPCLMYLMEFNPEAVLQLPAGERLLSQTVTSQGLEDQEIQELSRLAKNCLALVKNPGEEDLALLSHAMMILHILAKHTEHQEEIPVPLIPLSSKKTLFFESLYRFMYARRDDGLSQGEAAAHFGITPQYLGRFVKETTGMAFREYMASLAEESSALRRKYILPQDTASVLPGTDADAFGVHASAIPVLRRPSEARTRSEELHTILAPKQKLKDHWKKLINLGYAVNLRNTEIDAALAHIQSGCGFEYGRICRITDLVVTWKIGDRICHDFSQVFFLLDQLMKAGVIPFLELGNKAFTIQETTTISYAPLSPVDSRRYFSELTDILPDFLRACINHYGQENFDRWYFEISYMYTDTDARETFGFIQYVKVFRRIREIIRQFSTRCRIGGPGFNDWSHPGKIQQAIRLLASHDTVPDFFSAYIYPVVIEDGKTSLSGDPETAGRRIEAFAASVRNAYPDAEIWITEYNSNLSSRSFLNDSCYQAAFIAKMMFCTLKLRITALAYYLLSDAPLRYLDSLDFMFGGWGLFTDRAIPKASWHVCRMFSMLGHYRILQTDNVLITANSRGSLAILLYRYRHPGERFCTENVTRDDLLSPDAVFTNPGSDSYRIRVDSILTGTYILKEYRINEACANPYAAWRELGFLYPKDDTTTRELMIRSSLIPSVRIHVQKEGRPFETNVDLTGNEVCLLSLELYSSHT